MIAHCNIHHSKLNSATVLLTMMWETILTIVLKINKTITPTLYNLLKENLTRKSIKKLRNIYLRRLLWMEISTTKLKMETLIKIFKKCNIFDNLEKLCVGIAVVYNLFQKDQTNSIVTIVKLWINAKRKLNKKKKRSLKLKLDKPHLKKLAHQLRNYSSAVTAK